MNKKGFNLDALSNVTLLEEADNLSSEEIFKQGFSAYTYGDGNLLSNNLRVKVETKCPINGSDDIIDVEIKYKTNVYGEFIEHHSFMNWVNTFKNEGMGLETTIVTIYNMIEKVCNPHELEVTGFVNTNNKLFNTCTRRKENDKQGTY